jgi:proteasome lid subunit RPN8/RPN11
MPLFNEFDSGFELPGRRRRHLEPADDYRRAESAAEQPPKLDDGPDRPARQAGDADDCKFLLPLPMKVAQSAFREIVEYFRSRQPEAAGILLGPVQDDVLVTHFIPDEEGDGTAVSFHLNAPSLNRVVKRVRPAGINVKGFIHSHPGGLTQPSSGDLAYMQRLFGLPANAEAQQCFLPIVCGGRVYAYVYARGRLWNAELILI